jgi:hypothetical protein
LQSDQYSLVRVAWLYANLQTFDLGGHGGPQNQGNPGKSGLSELAKSGFTAENEAPERKTCTRG